MNFLAHAHRHLDDPWAVAGTALPDWLRLLDRRLRLRPAHAAQALASGGELAALGHGLRAHHDDDRRFHAGPAFLGLTGEATAELRRRFPGLPGLRPSVVAHVAVELLLDGVLVAAEPALARRYQRAVAAVDGARLEREVGALLGRPAPGLAALVARFGAAPHLATLVDDRQVGDRLERVLGHVGLPPLPPGLVALLPGLRRRVGEEAAALLGAGAAVRLPAA